MGRQRPTHRAGSRQGCDGNWGLGGLAASLPSAHDLCPWGRPWAQHPRVQELCPSLGSPQSTTNPEGQGLRGSRAPPGQKDASRPPPAQATPPPAQAASKTVK